MKKMTSAEIINAFIAYFEAHQHLKIKSGSLVPKSDPTLLYINSGMAPLKPYFLGLETPPKPCLVNVQPCIRTIDIDDVGDRHHLTLFEMLGSWSIGDYYKERAVELAYGFLIGDLGFDPKRLYMSVYGGNDKLKLSADEVSEAAWRKMGVPDDHIVRLGDDNFWGPAGETGPCGPCTEVFYDTGDAFGPAYVPGQTEFDSVGRYIEIWNAGVFMELNKQKNGTFKPLPLKSVDTGSGVERMAMIMQGVDSVYETDLLGGLYKAVSDSYVESAVPPLTERKLRMLTDHIRASVFILGEGVAPSNEGRGYIPRKLIRKCVSTLVSAGIKAPKLDGFVSLVVKNHGAWYPHLVKNQPTICASLLKEVDEFIPLIEQGIQFMESEMKQMSEPGQSAAEKSKGSGQKVFEGSRAFQLVSTFGLPLEVIESYLEDKGWSLDRAAYLAHDAEHRKVSRVIRSTGQMGEEAVNWAQELIGISATQFLGYDSLSEQGRVQKIFHKGQSCNATSTADEIHFLCDKTPFYGESGGQEGDVGEAHGGKCKIEILGTDKEGEFIVHRGRILAGELSEGQSLTLNVGGQRRLDLRRNHSATHLMHSALREVLGDQATQKGSLVKATALRFDFNHPQALTFDELQKIEYRVNEMIAANDPAVTDVVDYDEAINKGAMALFGEKYTEKVRVVTLGTDSVELCGGTHVKATGDIGLFMIEAESSVAKGIRRIEAITGAVAIKKLQRQQALLKEMTQLLSSSEQDLPERVKALKTRAKNSNKVDEGAGKAQLGQQKSYDISVLGLNILLAQAEGTTSSVKELGDQWITQGKYSHIVLVAKEEEKVKLFSWSESKHQKKWPASLLLKFFIEPLGGRGGGRPNFAQGGIPNVADLPELFKHTEEAISAWTHKQKN